MDTLNNGRDLYEYVQRISKEIVEAHEKYGTDLYDLISEAADSSGYVIYPACAMNLLDVVWSEDIDRADDAIADMGGYPDGYTFWQVQSITAYWVLVHMIEDAVSEMKRGLK